MRFKTRVSIWKYIKDPDAQGKSKGKGDNGKGKGYVKDKGMGRYMGKCQGNG